VLRNNDYLKRIHPSIFDESEKIVSLCRKEYKELEKIMQSRIWRIELDLSLDDEFSYRRVLDFFKSCESCNIRGSENFRDEPIWIYSWSLPTPDLNLRHHFRGKYRVIKITIYYDFMDVSSIRSNEHFGSLYPGILENPEKTATLCRKEFEEFKALIGI
jgi:hypothetical protein